MLAFCRVRNQLPGKEYLAVYAVLSVAVIPINKMDFNSCANKTGFPSAGPITHVQYFLYMHGCSYMHDLASYINQNHFLRIMNTQLQLCMDSHCYTLATYSS